MSSTKKLIHCLVFLSAGALTACQQMPVKPNQVSVAKPAVTETPVTEPAVIPPATPDTTVNIVEAHVVDPAGTGDNSEKRTGEIVFTRLSSNFSGPICKDNANINLWKKRYAGNPRAFSNHLGEILPLLDYVSTEVERRDLPAEFALIPIIESWYQPHAVGAGGPSGLWQMIGTTAKNHGVKIQAGYDGRFSVVDSTDAALSYLGTLQGMFKDWQRAVMGYNAGEFRILRAIRSSGNKSEGEDYWPHGLSPITYAYIAKLQALSCLISQPEKNNLSLPNSKEFTPLAAILVSKKPGSLDSIAKHYQVDADTLRKNNPAYKHGQIASQAPRRILMPAYLATRDIADSSDEVSLSPEEPASAAGIAPIAETRADRHQVKSGDTLWSVAKKYGLTLVSLKKFNGLGRNAVLRVGQTLKLSP